MTFLDCLIGLAASAALTCVYHLRQLQLARKKASVKVRF